MNCHGIIPRYPINSTFYIFVLFFLQFQFQIGSSFILDSGGKDWDRTIQGPIPFPDSRNSHIDHYTTKIDVEEMKSQIKNIFYSAYNDYKHFAFPLDELDPLTCTGKNEFGGLGLTLVDTLDTLAILGNVSEYEWAVQWIGENLSFDIDQEVSVFETNIRVLGGLLSAHMISIDPKLPFFQCSEESHCYNSELLALAIDLGNRLMPAFQTNSGIPFGSVNLKHGVPSDETTITSTAGAGTFLLEFGLLSHLSGNVSYYSAARKACKSLFLARSSKDLIGNHLDIIKMKWTHLDSGVGAGIDSFFEYLLKSSILFQDSEILEWFNTFLESIKHNIWKNPWIYEVNLDSGQISWTLYNSLQSFWPGLMALNPSSKDFSDSIRTLNTFYSVYSVYGFNPEGYNFIVGNPQNSQLSYPLRPELIESVYWHYRRTRDPSYLQNGIQMFKPISQFSNVRSRISRFQNYSKQPTTPPHPDHYYKNILLSGCGFAGPNNVYDTQRFLSNQLSLQLINWDFLSHLDSKTNGKNVQYISQRLETIPLTSHFRSTMESFFLAETLKYYYLLFDSDNPFNSQHWLPTTEAHFIPVKSKYVIPRGHISKEWAKVILTDLKTQSDISDLNIHNDLNVDPSNSPTPKFSCSTPLWNLQWFPHDLLPGNDLTSSFCILNLY